MLRHTQRISRLSRGNSYLLSSVRYYSEEKQTRKSPVSFEDISTATYRVREGNIYHNKLKEN